MAFKTLSTVTARLLRAVFILGILSSPIMAAAVDAPQPTPAPSVATPVAAAPAPIAKPAPAPAASAMAKAAKAASLAGKPDIRPLWVELSPLQQQVLGPLALEWNKLDSNHKSKWLAIVVKYTTMSPEKQGLMEKNIRDWANMTPEQHRLARESYARTKKLDTEQKAAQWQQYQQLPEEQKQKLAADAKTKKRIANVPSLQNKPKTVEPLKSAKKSPANHTPGTANHIAPPPMAKTVPPAAPAVPVVATPAPAAAAPTALPPPVPPATK